MDEEVKKNSRERRRKWRKGKRVAGKINLKEAGREEPVAQDAFVTV